ncbi:hypothetical protein UWK_02263 [Desulfocapsa sulfexigens DSM 10523]|uniref:Nucleotide-diphospho-sugar transferase n=1 Tax=Desulfocapsa sulfexigens (strain DSM 10523 / SB164P1) TaxID=1167006 RepID=M1P5N1_DESSD|nr:hypothetical protein [Desulfocapsa sulfexigens]AGF78803.1 hypothetical protein UWK_02263 [Desulfocapsa sulfexigens DSM 10523]
MTDQTMTQSVKFTPPAPLNTAVLFLVFNRPDTTSQVFETIRKAKPPRLYVAADGPRPEYEGEAEKVINVREIATAVDWLCEVKTLFRDKNLGCKYAVSSAITWFFENEEQGIILEDDCLPNQSFFWFCEELLKKYKDDERVGQISGFNALGDFSINNKSYHFSNFGSIWGWASWRRAWSFYDVNLGLFPEVIRGGLLKGAILNNQEYKTRLSAFENTYAGKIDTWDYQWIFTRLVNRFLIVIPHVSLVKNIGFGEEATHTTSPGSNMGSVEKKDITLPLKHPVVFLPNINFEALVHERKKSAFFPKIIHKIKRLLRWVKR